MIYPLSSFKNLFKKYKKAPAGKPTEAQKRGSTPVCYSGAFVKTESRFAFNAGIRRRILTFPREAQGCISKLCAETFHRPVPL